MSGKETERMTTFVLLHGAYQGGWIWQPTAARLRAAGHLVYAPSLDGCAERRHQLRPGITVEPHAVDIAELLFYEDLSAAYPPTTIPRRMRPWRSPDQPPE